MELGEGVVGDAFLDERTAGVGAFGDLVLGEEFEGVVGVVVGGIAVAAGASLVELPGDACGFEALGVGGPGEAVGPGSFAEAGAIGLFALDVLGVDGAGPEIDAIGRGVGVDGAVIGVAEGEGVGEGRSGRRRLTARGSPW